MIRRQNITDNNQKETGYKISKAGKRYHFDNISGAYSPSGIKAVANRTAGNDGMTGIVADGKADKSGQNPFPYSQFSLNVF